MSGSRSLPIPPQPPLDLLRQMQSRGSAAQEFDPVAAAIAEQRRSSRRQPLPLPPMPPAVPPQRTGGSAEAGPPSVFPGETAGDAIPTRLGAALPPDNPWVAEAGRLAEKYNLPRDVFLSLVYQESRFNPEARSPKGAYGLAQLMPGTASDLKSDRYDPAQNLEAGAQYLRQLYDRFGSMPLALAAYNAGPNRVARAGNQIPQILETQNYVKKIMGRAGVDGYAEGGPVRESLDDMEDRYADAPAARPRRAGPDVARILDAATGLSDDEYDRRLAERDPLMTPASRLGVAGVPVPRGGREMYPGNAVSPFEAAASLIPRPEDVQRGMISAMAGIEIPEGGRIVQTDVTRSGYAIETVDGRLIDPEGRGGRDVRDFAPTVRRSAVLPVGQDVDTGETSLAVPGALDLLPMAGVQGGPAGTFGAGAGRRRALGTAEEILAAPRSDFPYLTEPMKLTDKERAALLAEPKPEGVGVRNEPPTGSMDVMASEPVVFRGREPKEWSPQDWGDYGREYGVPNLGPRSNEEWQRSLVDVDIGNRRISVPGGLDTDAPFTYYDLLHLKSQGIDPSTMPRDVHVALQRRMLASVTPEPGDPLAAYNGLIMGFASPNNPLFPNQMAMTRLRARSMEDVERLADMIPWKAGDEVPKSLRSEYDTRIAEAFGLDKGPEKGKAGTPATAAIPPSRTFIGQPARKATPDIAPTIGGTGARGSADYTRMAEFAQMFRDRPDFFTFRGAAEGGEDLANQWSNFVERLVSQTPGLSAKTGSFGAVWQDPSTAAISAIDRHMANQIGARMFRSDEAREQFFANVLERYNEGVGLKGDQKRKRIEDGQVRDIDEMLEREEGQTFLQDQLLQAAGQHKTPKYRIGKEGQLNPSMPEHLTPAAARWVREPENMALISDAYRAALSENARMAQREGLGLFGSQWLNWDRIRRRLEPHENMFPNLSNLPTMSLEQLNEARRAHRATGETDYKKVAPTAEEQAAAAAVGEDLGTGLRLRPVRPIENPSRLGYFALPPAYVAGEMAGEEKYARGGKVKRARSLEELSRRYGG